MASGSLFQSLTTSNIDQNIVIQSNYIGWVIALVYLSFVKVLGPRMMKNRKAFELQFVMIAYNIATSLANAYLALKIFKVAFDTWPVRCDPELIWKELLKEHYTTTWFIFLSKFSELFDTAIFILRKKFQQASVLHVFHHVAVFVLFWLCLKHKLGGYYIIFFGCLNLPIHVLLYSYYGLSAMGQTVRKYLWWKKYLTRLQIVQFFLTLSYIFVSPLSGCGKLTYFDQTATYACIIITVLFLNFYIRTYNIRK